MATGQPPGDAEPKVFEAGTTTALTSTSERYGHFRGAFVAQLTRSPMLHRVVRMVWSSLADDCVSDLFSSLCQEPQPNNEPVTSASSPNSRRPAQEQGASMA